MSERKNDVSVIGLYILDILGRPVERIPDGGQVEFIEEIKLTVAGTAGGTVVDLAKLGLDCLAVGAVGRDEKADFVMMILEKFGIDCSAMQRLSGVPTSATILNVRPNGDRPALHVRGASDHFEIDQVALPKIFEAPFVHLGGTGLLARLDGEPSRRLLASAKEAGCTTTFDLIATNSETIKLVEPLLPHIDYFMPSIEEARDLSGLRAAEDNMRFFLDRGVGTCVLTMGGQGSLIGRGAERIHLAAYDLDIVDTTGCGDAYSAGFIAGLARGLELLECGHLGAASASLVAGGLGSDAGIVSYEDTVSAMKRWREV